VCALPDLASGSGVVAHFTAHVDSANPGATAISTVSAAQGDPNTVNNSANIISIFDPVAAMALQVSSDSRVISWPAGGGSAWILEASETLLPGSWVRINIPPSIVGASYTVTLGSTNNCQFYRLRRQ
jgi:hypothetical protein